MLWLSLASANMYNQFPKFKREHFWTQNLTSAHRDYAINTQQFLQCFLVFVLCICPQQIVLPCDVVSHLQRRVRL